MNFVNRVCKEIEVMIKVCNEVLLKLFMIYYIVLDESIQNLIKIKDKLKDGKIMFCEFKDLEIFENGEMEYERNFL